MATGDEVTYKTWQLEAMRNLLLSGLANGKTSREINITVYIDKFGQSGKDWLAQTYLRLFDRCGIYFVCHKHGITCYGKEEDQDPFWQTGTIFVKMPDDPADVKKEHYRLINNCSERPVPGTDEIKYHHVVILTNYELEWNKIKRQLYYVYLDVN